MKVLKFFVIFDILNIVRFQESSESLGRMEPGSEGAEVLVPLTGSMYVPGQLSQPDKVIVDIGTGYYVEKQSKDAQDYFNRKVKYVTENMERVQSIGNEKAKIRDLVMDVMQVRLLASTGEIAVELLIFLPYLSTTGETASPVFPADGGGQSRSMSIASSRSDITSKFSNASPCMVGRM